MVYCNNTDRDIDVTQYVDLTDPQWALIESLLPAARGGGRKRTTDLRPVVNALLYRTIMRCRATEVPACYPPRTSLNEYARRWGNDGTMERILDALGIPSSDPKPLSTRDQHQAFCRSQPAVGYAASR
jgi:transposase